MQIRKLITLVATFVILTIGAYAIFVGIIGDHSYENSPTAWGDFSSYLNNILSPLLAFIAAMAAISSINESKKHASFNLELANSLQHIEITRTLIEKHWRSITALIDTNWEEKPLTDISSAHFPAKLNHEKAILSEVLNIGLVFQSLSFAAQWHAHLHKSQTSPITKATHPSYEWAMFSNAIMEDQSKKMKFCKVFLDWRQDEGTLPEKHCKEVLIQQGFYESLVTSKIIRAE